MDKWIIERCLMSKSLSCTAVLLPSLKGLETAYLNKFDILKKLFSWSCLREVLNINRARQLTTRVTVFEIYFQRSPKRSGPQQN